MKGNIALLLLAIILLEFVSAKPRVKENSKEQALRKGKGEKKSHDRKDRQKKPTRIPVQTPGQSIEEESVLEEGSSTSQGGESSSKEDGHKLKDSYVKRPLIVGDTFTAGELLPVTKKLLEKVDHPGTGKGIVSSSSSPQELADKLFQAFFLTENRIVTLTDFDISGLDALQSLALVGDPATSEKFAKRTHEKKEKAVLNGQIVEVNDKAKRSRYNMLHKIKSSKRKAKVNARKKMKHAKRNGLPKNALIKRLGKNRHMVVSRKKNQNKISQNKNPCRWSYECRDPTDLDTCRLKAKCTRRTANEKVDPAEYINSRIQNIDPKIVAHFRKSLSIHALDEEVEKIIESRVLKLRPENTGSEEIEGLSEYFRKIMLAENGGGGNGDGTTPLPPEEAPQNTDEDKQKPDTATVSKLPPLSSTESADKEAEGTGEQGTSSSENEAMRDKKGRKGKRQR